MLQPYIDEGLSTFLKTRIVHAVLSAQLTDAAAAFNDYIHVFFAHQAVTAVLAAQCEDGVDASAATAVISAAAVATAVVLQKRGDEPAGRGGDVTAVAAGERGSALEAAAGLLYAAPEDAELALPTDVDAAVAEGMEMFDTVVRECEYFREAVCSCTVGGVLSDTRYGPRIRNDEFHPLMESFVDFVGDMFRLEQSARARHALEAAQAQSAKEKGNAAYKAKNLTEAIALYSSAIYIAPCFS